MKYKEWLVEWLGNYIMPSAKDKTYVRYSDIANQHLIPNLGEYELNELSPIVVQRFITELMQFGNLRTGKGLAANSINSIITSPRRRVRARTRAKSSSVEKGFVM